MIKAYRIKGMSCSGCIKSVKTDLEKIADVQEANVQLDLPQALIKMTKAVELKTLQSAIGNYQISAFMPSKL